MAHNDPLLASGIVSTAQALGMSPLDLATIISYETAGTFDPAKRGPTTKWGQHRGLIQFGEPQARQYGVDWNDPLGSQLGPDGAVAKYFRASGFKPGMGLLDAYSTVNAGAPGLYNRSDEAAGGAPGTVRDKVEQQMGGHRRNAERLLGDMSSGRLGGDSMVARDFGPQIAAATNTPAPQPAPPLNAPRMIADRPIAPMQGTPEAPQGLLALLGNDGAKAVETGLGALMDMAPPEPPQMLQPPMQPQQAALPPMPQYVAEFLASRLRKGGTPGIA